ncbi:hypothetical protein ACVGXE_00705, partial [Escherichia coli]
MIVLILVSRLVIGEQMIDVLGPEKRRRRTTQEKIAIVQQSFEPGMTCPYTHLRAHETVQEISYAVLCLKTGGGGGGGGGGG